MALLVLKTKAAVWVVTVVVYAAGNSLIGCFKRRLNVQDVNLTLNLCLPAKIDFN